MFSHVRIGPVVYEIQRVSLDGEMGNCDNNNLIIEIDSDIKEVRSRATLLHEILHACSFEYNADVPSDQEEECTRAHEVGLMNLSIDHPEILRYLFKL